MVCQKLSENGLESHDDKNIKKKKYMFENIYIYIYIYISFCLELSA